MSTEVIAGAKCPQCGAGMFRRPACCKWRRQGWATILKCISPKCKYKQGERKR